MSERPRQTDHIFGFNDDEFYAHKIGNDRLQEILADPQTQVHNAKIDSNDYGEFVFITASRPKGDNRESVTFWGMGLHEQRDRWMTNEWEWYSGYLSDQIKDTSIDPNEVKDMLSERRMHISASAQNHQQSREGRAFEWLADLTDDDGAQAEIEDMGGMDRFLDMLDGQE